MSEKEESLRDKGKRIGRRARETAQTVSGTLTGKNIEQQVAEYSELYTQVLLGLHRDVEALDIKLDEQASEIETLKCQVADMRRSGLSRWLRSVWPWRRRR